MWPCPDLPQAVSSTSREEDRLPSMGGGLTGGMQRERDTKASPLLSSPRTQAPLLLSTDSTHNTLTSHNTHLDSRLCSENAVTVLAYQTNDMNSYVDFKQSFAVQNVPGNTE